MTCAISGEAGSTDITRDMWAKLNGANGGKGERAEQSQGRIVTVCFPRFVLLLIAVCQLGVKVTGATAALSGLPK